MRAGMTPQKCRHSAIAFGLLAACLFLSGCSPEAREGRYMEAGKRQMQKKDYARAILQFMNAAKAMPKDAEPNYQLGLAYLARNDFQSAYYYFKKAVDLNPKHQQAQLKRAQLLAATNNKANLEEAQQKVHELLSSTTSTAEILDTLATAEWKLGNQQDAEKHLEEAFTKFPKDLASAVALSRIRIAHKDMLGAEEVLKKAASQQPPSANAFMALGHFYMSTGKTAEAEAQFRRAIAADSKSGPALLSLAVLQVRTGKLDDAGRSYSQLSALPDIRYRPYHAAFLAARGQHGPAIAEFEKLNRQYPEDRDIRTYLVREYLTTQKTAEAETLISAALSKNPKDVDALLQRAGVYLISGRADDAQKDLTQALHFRPDSAEAHFLMAKVHQLRGALLNQRAELSEVLRLRPDYLPARAQLSQLLITSGAAKSALDLMDAVPPAQKGNLGVLIQRNWALLALNQPAEVRTQVDRGLAAVRLPELLIQDAYLKLQQKDYSAARASLVEALNKSPEDLRILRLIVASYAAEKQPAAAVSVVREYAQQHAKSALAQQFLADVLLANGQRQQARTALLAAKAANPKFTQADLSLARLDATEGHVNEASKTLSSILTENPNNVPARLMLASIKETRGNPNAAIDDYKKILQVQPGNVLALNNLAYDLVEYGNQADEALKYAQRAAELAPEAPAVENTLGWVLYRKGMYSLAVPHLEKAADKEPSARRRCHLAMAYLKMGDQERGQKNLEAAVKLDPNIPEIKTAQQLLDDMQGAR